MSTADIPDGSRVVIDTSAFIYFLEQHPRYHRLADELFRRVETGRLSGCASVLVFAELLVPYHRAGDVAQAEALADTVRSIQNLEMIPADGQIAERAASLRGKHGLRTPDALHVATGLEHQASAWLVTNDSKLKRVAAEGIEVWLFDEHV